MLAKKMEDDVQRQERKGQGGKWRKHQHAPFKASRQLVSRTDQERHDTKHPKSEDEAQSRRRGMARDKRKWHFLAFFVFFWKRRAFLLKEGG